MQDDEVTFNVFEAIKYPMNKEDCFQIDAIENLTRELFQEGHPTLPLESCITDSDTSKIEHHARRECTEYLEATTGLLKEEKFMKIQHLLSTLVPSIQPPPKLELKELPSHLRFAYLGENSTL